MQFHTNRLRAVVLRKKGYSYSHISNILDIPKATLSNWLTEIAYSPNRETLLKIGKARSASIWKRHEMKRQSIVNAESEAKSEVAKVTKRDLFMFGLGLYLGEGSKTASCIRLVNADPRVIIIAIKWFKIHGYSQKNFTIRLHLYPDLHIKKSLLFWSNATTIPQSQFQKTYIDVRGNKKRGKKGKLPHGTAHLSVRSLGDKRLGSFFVRKIHAWTEEVIKRS